MNGVISFLQGLVNIFLSARYRVEGESMLPSLADRETVLVVRMWPKWNRLRRGDVVVFEPPGGVGGIYIKRVVGLPGEDLRTVDGRVYLDGQILEEKYVQTPGVQDHNVPAPEDDGQTEAREWFNGLDEYFLLGDNRVGSIDSRVFGPVAAELIQGRAWFRCWPPSKWRSISRS